MKQTSDAAGASATLAPVQLVKVADIVPDPKNRKDHNPAALSCLAASIDQDGLLQPIVLRPLDGGKFMLIAGERRWRAHQLLNRDTIEARVAAASAGLESTRKRLAENFHREDLSPIERARDLAQLEADGMAQKEIAAFVGARDQSTVSNFIRLLKLPKSVQAKVHAGELSAAHGKAIARFERWPAVCEVLAGEALRQKISSKDLERDVPCDWLLEQKKLIVRIDLGKPYSFDDRPQFKLPESLQQDPDFLKLSAENWVCFAPAKWAPERERQLAEFAKRQKTAESNEAGKQSTMSAADKKARQKKIADNKAARAAVAAALETAKTKLINTKGLAPELIQVVVDTALQANGGRFRSGLQKAAAALGLKLPKTPSRGYVHRQFEFPQLLQLTPADATRVAVMAIVMEHCEEAHKWAADVPEAATHIVGKPAKKGCKGGAS